MGEAAAAAGYSDTGAAVGGEPGFSGAAGDAMGAAAAAAGYSDTGYTGDPEGGPPPGSPEAGPTGDPQGLGVTTGGRPAGGRPAGEVDPDKPAPNARDARGNLTSTLANALGISLPADELRAVNAVLQDFSNRGMTLSFNQAAQLAGVFGGAQLGEEQVYSPFGSPELLSELGIADYGSVNAPTGARPGSAFNTGVSGLGVPGLENTSRGGFGLTGPQGYGPQEDSILGYYTMPENLNTLITSPDNPENLDVPDPDVPEVRPDVPDVRPDVPSWTPSPTWTNTIQGIYTDPRNSSRYGAVTDEEAERAAQILADSIRAGARMDDRMALNIARSDLALGRGPQTASEIQTLINTLSPEEQNAFLSNTLSPQALQEFNDFRTLGQIGQTQIGQTQTGQTQTGQTQTGLGDYLTGPTFDTNIYTDRTISFDPERGLITPGMAENVPDMVVLDNRQGTSYTGQTSGYGTLGGQTSGYGTLGGVETGLGSGFSFLGGLDNSSLGGQDNRRPVGYRLPDGRMVRLTEEGYPASVSDAQALADYGMLAGGSMGILGGQASTSQMDPRIARQPPPDQTYSPLIARQPPPDQSNFMPSVSSVLSNTYSSPPRTSGLEGSTRGSWDIDGTWKEAE